MDRPPDMLHPGFTHLNVVLPFSLAKIKPSTQQASISVKLTHHAAHRYLSDPGLGQARRCILPLGRFPGPLGLHPFHSGLRRRVRGIGDIMPNITSLVIVPVENEAVSTPSSDGSIQGSAHSK